MRRNSSIWVYLLSVGLSAAMTIALLPACGSSGGGETCNSGLEEIEGAEAEQACSEEEIDEEESDSELEKIDEAREDTGLELEEAVIEISSCEEIGCREFNPE